MRNNIFCFMIILIMSIMVFSCKKEITSPDLNSIKFISFIHVGCIQGKKGRVDVAKIETNYINGELEVDIIFTNLCSAKLKDSVSIDEKKVNIFLKDVNPNASRCDCLQKEKFLFKVSGMKEIGIKFNYDYYAMDGYYTLADTTIQLK
jgi:hypothetical protein